MSEKARDNHGRWRSKTIAFRMSPEENQLLDDMVRLSGLTKQEYIVRRVLQTDVTVMPNPRVHKALKEKIEALCLQMEELRKMSDITPEFLCLLEFVGRLCNGLLNG